MISDSGIKLGDKAWQSSIHLLPREDYHLKLTELLFRNIENNFASKRYQNPVSWEWPKVLSPLRGNNFKTTPPSLSYVFGSIPSKGTAEALAVDILRLIWEEPEPLFYPLKGKTTTTVFFIWESPPPSRGVVPILSITTTRMTMDLSSAHPHKTYLCRYLLHLVRITLDAGWN